MGIIRRLQLVDTWAEIKGIEAAIFEALQREEQAEKDEQAAFKHWKDTNEKEKAPF